MKIVSINIGQPQLVKWQNKNVKTAIFKAPVQGLQKASFTSIEGDGQADLKYHGGTEKALYSFDSSYYNNFYFIFMLDQCFHFIIILIH